NVVGAVADQDALGIDAENFPGDGAKIVAEGLGILAELVAGEGFANRLEDSRRRRIRTLVRVKLDHVRPIDLLAGSIAGHAANGLAEADHRLPTNAVLPPAKAVLPLWPPLPTGTTLSGFGLGRAA